MYTNPCRLATTQMAAEQRLFDIFSSFGLPRKVLGRDVYRMLSDKLVALYKEKGHDWFRNQVEDLLACVSIIARGGDQDV